MKKLLTITALMGVATLSSFAQGYVNFANAVSSTTHIQTNSVVGGANTGRISGPAGAYYFGLFVAPNGTAFSPTLAGWTPVPGSGTNTTLGRFAGATDSNGFQVPGYGPGSTAAFLVAGWSGNLGSRWQDVSSWYTTLQTTGTAPTEGYFGFSAAIQNVVVGGGAIPVPGLFGPNAGQTLGFGLALAPTTIVPEPTSFALAGIGAAALMIFRRRK